MNCPDKQVAAVKELSHLEVVINDQGSKCRTRGGGSADAQPSTGEPPGGSRSSDENFYEKNTDRKREYNQYRKV